MTDRPILFNGAMVRAILAGQKTQTRRVMKVQPDDESIVTVERYFSTVIDRRGDEQPGPEIFGAWWGDGESGVKFPYGEPGDRLWVRETWCGEPGEPNNYGAGQHRYYRADYEGHPFAGSSPGRWTPSIHMPRWASRITLEITGVRVERLQAISEADALAEGVAAKPFPGPWWQGYRRMEDGEVIHQQAVSEQPPAWMVEPHEMRSTKHLDRSAIDGFRSLWHSINGAESWAANPWVWIVEFRRALAADWKGQG